MKKVDWRWDWGCYVPFCPYCDELAYNKNSCVFCGKKYKWVEPKYKPTVLQVGEYTVTQATNNHISITKNGKMLFHAQCQKKCTNEELEYYVKFYKELLESRK